MKKIIAFLIVGLVSVSVHAQQPGSSKVKIYVRTISCIKESLDDIFDGDGKGNEIFATVFYSVSSRNGTTRYANKTTTAVYGDITGKTGRIKAGTAGYNGGIKAGDVVYANPNTEAMMPVGDERFKGQLMFEADLAADDILTVMPVLWEWDSESKNTQLSFESFLMNSFNTINIKSAQVAQKFNTRTWPYIYSQSDECIDLAGMKRILQGVNGITGNRPIGMALTGAYNPAFIVMNQTILQNWSAVKSFINGKLIFNYDETYLGNTRDHGYYSMEVTMANTPAVNTNVYTGPVKTIPGSTTTRPIKGMPIIPAITGTWKGSWGYAENSTTNFLSYQFNNDGTMLLLSQVGATEAKGTYTFTNNILTASYSYLGGGAISASGVYNPSTGQLTGTWGRNSETSGGGRWVQNK